MTNNISLTRFQILTALFLFIFIHVSLPTEARRFQQVNQNTSDTIQSTIKVSEYRYVERKLVKHADDHSVLNRLFGESENHQHLQSELGGTNKSNRILMPQMIGGLQSLFKHIEYPVQAKVRGVEGIVKVEFTVNELGMVEDVVIIDGIGAGCDSQVIRALKKTRFSPAVLNGRFVKVKLSQSVVFELKSLRS